MPDYHAPTDEIRFLLNDVFESGRHYASLPGAEDFTPELLDSIIEGAAEFAEKVVGPLYRSGDQQGCRFDDGRVSTPDGFGDAFRAYGEGGWQGLTASVEDGGQGLPASLGFVVTEMVGSANWAWSMYPGLALAPVNCLSSAGTEAMKRRYLPPLLDGRWAGTMCLTEAHCGSDVGLIRTKATRAEDGSYRLTGSKIFVSGGEQDITENIVHSVLARVEGAPSGTKGLSLFIVPKVHVDENGALGAPNAVSCGSIEHKMGLKGSATCVMNFDGATAELVGEENRGLEVMFELMNTARLGTALQGVAMGEVARQWALAYARERHQMRSLSGAKAPDAEADPIIVHPDVRRMLLTQKALVEGGRAMICWLGQLVDRSLACEGEEAKAASDLLEFLTPVAKAFCTETCQEVTGLGLQVYGGHGFVSDNGVEQVIRDARIATVYEGTTGIQALDLVGRKVLGSGGALLRNVTELIHAFCHEHASNPAVADLIGPLAEITREWEAVSKTMTERAIGNLDELGASSVDFTMLSGYVLLGYLWARIAVTAGEGAGTDGPSEAFRESKRVTARFYFTRLLPRATAHATAALAGAGVLMSLPEEAFGA